MKNLRLSADYSCYPIWHDDGELTGEYGNIDPRSLPISEQLANDCIKWAAWFDSFINIKDPYNSREISSEEKQNFDIEKKRLLHELTLELSNKGYKIRT